MLTIFILELCILRGCKCVLFGKVEHILDDGIASGAGWQRQALGILSRLNDFVYNENSKQGGNKADDECCVLHLCDVQDHLRYRPEGTLGLTEGMLSFLYRESAIASTRTANLPIGKGHRSDSTPMGGESTGIMVAYSAHNHWSLGY